jgi:hypothetical protein
LENKPESCVSIKVLKDFNENTESTFTINSIKDVDETLLNNCFNVFIGEFNQ